jgi:WD40 repeat protein
MRSALWSLLLAGPGLLVAAAPPPPVPAEVRKLIAQLGDDDAEVRQAAAKKLEGLGEEVVPALLRASINHTDVDVRLRAAVVAAAIKKKLYGEIRCFKGHTWGVFRLVVTPDGKHIATSSFDRTVRLWDAKTLQVRKHMTVTRTGCDSVAFTPDGRRLVTTGCGDDHAVRVWEIDTGKERCRFDGHTGHVLAVAVTSDGRHAVSGSSDSTLRLWPMPRSAGSAKRR